MILQKNRICYCKFALIMKSIFIKITSALLAFLVLFSTVNESVENSTKNANRADVILIKIDFIISANLQ